MEIPFSVMIIIVLFIVAIIIALLQDRDRKRQKDPDIVGNIQTTEKKQTEDSVQKKEIAINKSILNATWQGFIIAFIIVVIIQCFGSFSFIPGLGYYFESPFGYRSDFLRNNESQLYIYVFESFKHFQYILYFWIPTTAILIFFKKYCVRIK